MSRISTGIAVLTLGLLTFIAASGEGSAAGGNPSPVAAAPARLCATALAVSPDEAFMRLKREPDLLLVDVRSPAEHAQLRIPGSLGIPLAFVKTKAFLRRQPVVLVGDGFRNAALIDECRVLKTMGFNVAILEGGLAGWGLRGFPLEGDRFALAALRRVSSQTAHQEEDAGSLRVVDLSKPHGPKSDALFAAVVHLPEGLFAPGGKRKLAPALTKNGCLTPLLVTNETGDGYDLLAGRLSDAGINAYFLEGGLAGYRRHLEALSLSWQSREARLRSLSPCRPCGRRAGVEENP